MGYLVHRVIAHVRGPGWFGPALLGILNIHYSCRDYTSSMIISKVLKSTILFVLIIIIIIIRIYQQYVLGEMLRNSPLSPLPPILQLYRRPLPVLSCLLRSRARVPYLFGSTPSWEL